MFLLLLFDCSKVLMGEFLQFLHVEELQTDAAPSGLEVNCTLAVAAS